MATIQSEPAVRSLAEFGWTVPVDLPMGLHHVLLEKAGTSAEIDDFFTGYYRTKRRKHFRVLSNALLGAPSLASQRDLLSECLWAFEKDRYRICVPSLCTILEGVIAQAARPGQERQTKVPAAAAALAAQIEPGDLVWLLLRSVQYFVEFLFEWSPFDGPAPGRLNRHWILHGRAATEWGEAEALRLLNAIRSTSFAIEQLGQSQDSAA